MTTELRPFKDLSPDEKENAKNQFLKYKPVASIAREMSVKRTTLQYHATNYWIQEREAMKAEVFSEFHDTKRTDFVKMSTSSIKIIQRALKDLADRDMPPSMREAQQATAVLEVLDKITRLDDGSPTDITAEKPISIEAVKKKLLNDPFQKVEEVEYKEVKEDE